MLRVLYVGLWYQVQYQKTGNRVIWNRIDTGLKKLPRVFASSVESLPHSVYHTTGWGLLGVQYNSMSYSCVIVKALIQHCSM